MVRVITAFKITGLALYDGKMPHLDFLFWFHYDFEKNPLTTEQKRVLLRDRLTERSVLEIKEYFLKIYNDEQLIVDFLNKKITKYYFTEKRRLTKSKDDINNNIKEIMDNTELFDLIGGL